MRLSRYCVLYVNLGVSVICRYLGTIELRACEASKSLPKRHASPFFAMQFKNSCGSTCLPLSLHLCQMPTLLVYAAGCALIRPANHTIRLK